jgi:hypothetical protein
MTHPVGAKAPNAWGLYDMHGNVWEWCEDGRREYGHEAVSDQRGSEETRARRVVRGGCCWSYARLCRSAYRFAIEPGFRNEDQGFRFAAGPTSQEPVGGAPGPEAGGADAPVPEAPAQRGPAERLAKTMKRKG